MEINFKDFLNKCADRDCEVVIKDEFSNIIAKGTVWNFLVSQSVVLPNHITYEEILSREVYCFFFSDDALYICLDERKKE